MALRGLIVSVWLTAAIIAAAWQPDELPGLQLWLDAGTAIDTDADGAVTCWHDRSENDNDALPLTAVTRPQLVTGAANGQQVVRFDGIDDVLALRAAVPPGGKSVYAVVRWRELRGYSFAIGLDGGTDGYLRLNQERQLVTGGAYPIVYQNAVACPKDCPPGYGRKVFHFLPRAVGELNSYGVVDNPVSEFGIKYLGQNEHNNVPTNRFAGDIAELLIYDRPLPVDERILVESYLGCKYRDWPPLAMIAVDLPSAQLLTSAIAMTPPGGVLYHGFSDQALGPGRYRVHLQTAIHGDVGTHQFRLRFADQEVPVPVTVESTQAALDFELGPEAGHERRLIRLRWLQDELDAVDAQAQLTELRLHLERLSPVLITALQTDKNCYRPGATATVNASLRNAGDQPLQLQLRCREVWGFQDQGQVHEQPLLLPPGPTQQVAFTFTVAAEEYGHAVELEVWAADRRLTSASYPYSVADCIWKVAIGGNPGGPAGSSARYSEAQIVAQIEQFRDDHVNVWEKYFWAPDDWGELTPEPGATWVSGQARRYENTEHIKLQIDTSHAYGIQVVTYGKCMAGGAHGWDLARARPQWFVTDVYGRTMGRPASVWDFEHWQSQTLKYADFDYVWTYRWVDLRRLAPLDYGIDELIASTDQFGWDGVRFDSGGFRAHWVDGHYNGNDAVNTRNHKRMKERIWQRHPTFIFGYNTDNPGAADGRAYPTDIKQMSHEMREMLAGGGLWMGEAIKDFCNGKVQYQTWRQLAEDERRCVSVVKQAGGHFCYLFAKGKPARDLYQFVIGMMIGAHPYGGEHVGAPGSPNWGRFLTRWSGLLWDHRLRPLAATDGLTVQTQSPLWWREFVNTRALSPRRRQLILHLLNPPVAAEIAAAGDLLPAAVHDCKVTFQLPLDEQLISIHTVSPERPDIATAHDFGDAANGGQVEVSVPTFAVWTMVVFELEGNYQQVPPTSRYSEPLTAAESAELSRLRPTEQTEPSFGLRPPAVTPNIATADDLRNPTAQHTAAAGTRDFGAPGVDLIEFDPGPGLDVLSINGFYHRLYRVPQALALVAPTARLHEVTARDLPADFAALCDFRIIVLNDFGADQWHAAGHAALAERVRRGARLIVLGGPFTLGQGFFKGTAIEAVLPVSVRVAKDVYQLPEPLPLGAAPNQPLAGNPLLYYYHAVTPQAAAKPVLWAGDLPIAWEFAIGDGSCVVFAGTMLGEARTDDETPFWQTDAWLQALGKLLVP